MKCGKYVFVFKFLMNHLRFFSANLKCGPHSGAKEEARSEAKVLQQVEFSIG